MSKISEQKALEAYPLPKEETESTSFINQETFNSAKRTGYIKGYDQAMQDLSEKAIIAYCEVCKLPNCIMQNQKEICPYLSKFRRCLESLLND